MGLLCDQFYMVLFHNRTLQEEQQTSLSLAQQEHHTEKHEPAEVEETPPSHKSSSSPDEAVMPLPPCKPDDFKVFHDLMKCLADTLQIPLEK